MENSEKKYGIVNIILILSFLIKLKDSLPALFAKGENIFAQVMSFMPIIAEGENFVEALSAAKDEFADLDDEEKEEIKIYFMDNFSLNNEVTEERIERIFNWAIETFDLVVDYN